MVDGDIVKRTLFRFEHSSWRCSFILYDALTGSSPNDCSCLQEYTSPEFDASVSGQETSPGREQRRGREADPEEAGR